MEPTVETSRRIKPHQLALGLGVLIAAVTVVSGIAATVFQFHGESEITREVFGNIPSPIKAAFYMIVPITLLKHHFRNYPNAYLSGQSYLNPDPQELKLRGFY